MIWFLWEKWNIHVHRFIIFRLIKRREWSNKKTRRIESQDEELRQHWIADLLDLTIEQLIFIDESMFNETIDWRLRVYALIDQSVRYQNNIIKERIWSVLSIYISNDELNDHSNDRLTDCFLDYLFCMNIKENYFNEDEFYNWIINDLLSLCNVYSTSQNVIIMNDNSTHVNSRIRDAIETYECRVKYLSSYSSDYNSIELSFEMLKSWVRHHFHELWSRYDESFENFLSCVINRSQCDQFAKKHFKYSADEKKKYIFENDIQTLNEQLHARNIKFEWSIARSMKIE
jgi:hypothetical protein